MQPRESSYAVSSTAEEMKIMTSPEQSSDMTNLKVEEAAASLKKGNKFNCSVAEKDGLDVSCLNYRLVEFLKLVFPSLHDIYIILYKDGFPYYIMLHLSL